MTETKVLHTKTELLSTLRQHLPQLQQRYPIYTLGLFGSYVRNEQQLDSDIDLLLELGSPISLFRFMELEDDLSQLFGVKVDLVLKKTLKTHIGRQILQEVEYP